MEQKKIIAYVRKAYRVSPREEWLLHSRAELLAHARRTWHPASRFAAFWETLGAPLHMFREQRVYAMGIAAAVCVMVLGGSVTVAARRALPSGTLYPVKLLAEHIKRSVAFTSEQQADYGIAAAAERIQELTLLSGSNVAEGVENTQAALIARTVERYTEALGSSTKTVKQLRADGKNAVARRTAEKLGQTARAYEVLLAKFDSATSEKALEGAKAAAAEAQATAVEILQAPEDASESATSTDPTQENDAAAGAAEGAEAAASPTPSETQKDVSATVRMAPLPNVVE